MREIENISSALFDKIRTRFNNVSLGDEKAKTTTDPEKARFFNFDYTVDGHSIGNITVSLIDENNLKVYYGTDILDNLDADDSNTKDEWYVFLRGLRKFAKRNMLSFDTRDIAKSNLQLKDIKQQSKNDGTLDVTDLNVTESKLYGSKFRSFRECGPAKIIVVHKEGVDDEQRGSRSRRKNIDRIFIETHLGERFLLPECDLDYAGAMARHISEGGRLEDEMGENITGMCREKKGMAHFVRASQRRQFEDTETSDMAKSAVHRYTELKKKLQHIGGPRGYQYYKETYMPECDIGEEIDVDALRERFVKKVYDDRFDEALPYVYRAYKKQQESMDSPMAEEFESWANDMTEGTWAAPTHKDDVDQLDRLMQKPISAGPNGENATALMYDIIGDDSLFDKIHEKADSEGQDADIRPVIVDWLRDNGYAELADKYGQQYTQNQEPLQAQDQAVQQQQVQQQAGQTAPVGNNMMGDPNVAEQADPLDFIRSLAGLRK